MLNKKKSLLYSPYNTTYAYCQFFKPVTFRASYNGSSVTDHWLLHRNLVSLSTYSGYKLIMCLTVHSPPWVRIPAAWIIPSCPGSVSSMVASFQVDLCVSSWTWWTSPMFIFFEVSPRLPVVFAKRCERFRSPSSPILPDVVSQSRSTVKQIGLRKTDVCEYHGVIVWRGRYPASVQQI